MPTTPAASLRIAVSLPVRNTFSYAVPKELKAVAEIGRRVTVPFQGLEVTGYILGKSLAYEHNELKEVTEVLDDEPLFYPQIVPFFEWVADYYVYPIGKVIQSVLPGGLNKKSFKVASLTETGHEALLRLPPHYDEIKILAWIKDNPDKRLPFSFSEVEPLKKRGWLIITEGTCRRHARPLMRRFIRLKERADLDDVQVKKGRGTGAKNEMEFFEAIGHGDPVLLCDLTAKFSNAGRLVNKWVKAGLLETGMSPVFRNPAGEIITQTAPPLELYDQQVKVLSHIRRCLDRKTFSTCLLHGVTGSGKTEVYLRAIEYALAHGRQAILLTPEISLAAYMEGIFRSRLGDRVIIYHSGLSPGERYDQWRRIARGEADLVIGARSALFAPLPRLGLIMVDEEHDTSYKQDAAPRYQGRDAAVVRCKMEGALAILGSGTPSIQSFQNCLNRKYHLLVMSDRVEKRPLPDIEIVDMRPPRDKPFHIPVISRRLKKAIEDNLASGNQTLLFLNRRGFHRMYVCRSCGKPVSCPHCDVGLTYHLEEDRLVCHYCGFSSGTHLICPSCGYPRLRAYGFGTEKVEQDLKGLFPDAHVARMDADSTKKKGEAVGILKRFSEHKIDILVGTQMITKGYDFPMVTLVGVVAADLSLGFPDFRAAERTFQILEQVAGRAGRGEQRGRVIIQTFNPDHYAIEAAARHDFDLFFKKEKALRFQLGYPPFSRLAFLMLKGNSMEETKEACHVLTRNIMDVINRTADGAKETQVLGPVQALVSKIKGKYRWQILIKSRSALQLQNLLEEAEAMSKNILKSKGVSLAIDVDPYQMG
ncbi:Primosomal protein N [uncultured Desulfobacterium sp.]|uniref:Replication restart protein PriA n=1 Tax=uncultured Desulfobacterium sp. TaxID=201089 RepID=A0A445MZQ3_9BACT|nr:Primosomal protein N [uncultured Desulfobacterium sp.]